MKSHFPQNDAISPEPVFPSESIESRSHWIYEEALSFYKLERTDLTAHILCEKAEYLFAFLCDQNRTAAFTLPPPSDTFQHKTLV